MSYTQRVIEKFGGLQLRASIETSPENYAVDGSDFDLDDGGVVRERNSFQGVIGGARPSAAADFPSPTANCRRYVIGCFNGDVYVYDHNYVGDSWSLVTITAGAGVQISGVVKYGTPNSQFAILTYATGPFQVIDVTTGTVYPQGTYIVNSITGVATLIAVGSQAESFTAAGWAGENRVVYGGFVGAGNGPGNLNASRDHVWISEPGELTYFRDDAFLVLGAGDGERVTCVKAWRDMVFVFKETKFFVLLNTSSSARGTPTFNYRTVDTGVGCVGPRAVAVGRDGLYFVGQRGLYVTRGGDPTLVSGAVEPIWTRESNSRFSHPAIDMLYMSGCSLAFSNERLYLNYRGVTATPGTFNMHRTLVLDLAHGWWSIWKTMGGGPDPFVASMLVSGERRLFTAGGDNATVGTQATGVAMMRTVATGTDSGQSVPINSYYQTGFLDLAADSVARVRQVEVWGTLLQRLYAAVDYKDTNEIDTGVDVAAYGGFDRGFVRLAFVGQRASVGVGGFAGELHTPWKVSRIVLHISNKTVPSHLK